MSFADFVDAYASVNPLRPAIVARDRNVLYEELARRVRYTDAVEGETVALDVPDAVDYVTCFIGCLSAGARVIPIIQSQTDFTKSKIVSKTKARVVRTVKVGRPSSFRDTGEVLHATSGSTGPSKLVVRPFGNLQDEAIATSQRLQLTPTLECSSVHP